jgi:hypothetical protein
MSGVAGGAEKCDPHHKAFMVSTSVLDQPRREIAQRKAEKDLGIICNFCVKLI